MFATFAAGQTTTHGDSANADFLAGNARRLQRPEQARDHVMRIAIAARTAVKGHQFHIPSR
jgi:hypothetical protein